MDSVRAHLVRRGAGVILLLDAAVRPVAARPRLHQGLPARRARERRPVHPRRRLGRSWRSRALGQRRRGGRAVPHAQPDQPHAHAGRTSRATRSSPTSSPPTSTPTRRTPAAAAGPGTPARPAGCTGPGSRASSACTRRGDDLRDRPRASPPSWPGFAIAWRFGGTRYEIAVANPESRCRGVAERGRSTASASTPAPFRWSTMAPSMR